MATRSVCVSNFVTTSRLLTVTVFYFLTSSLFLIVMTNQWKVFGGTVAVLGFCAITFYGPKQKADGHNLFDLNKLVHSPMARHNVLVYD